MNRKTSIAVAAAAVCLGGIVLLSNTLGDRPQQDSPKPNVAAPLAEEAPATRVSAIKPEVATSDFTGSAAAHHTNIKTNAQSLAANTKAQLEGTFPETTTAELMALQQAEMEKRLTDSMSSLTQQLIRDPSFAASAIAMLSAETDPEIMMLLAQAIGEAASALGDKFPADALLKLAEENSDLDRRRAALVALGYMTKIPGDVQQRMAQLSQTAPTPELRMAAINSMGAWANSNPDMVQRISETLLAARTATDDPSVRGMVLQTIGNLEKPLTPKVLEAMTDAIRNEPEPMNRSLAALAMGTGIDSGNRQAILSTLEQAYITETKLDTRRHIITQITKAARYDAEDYLQRLPTDHPQLAQDVEDYVQILANADRSNWGEIWEKKSELDHQRNTYPSAHGGHGAESN